MNEIIYNEKIHTYSCEDTDFIDNFLKDNYLLDKNFRGRLDFGSIVVRDMSSEGYRSEIFLFYRYKSLKDLIDDLELGGILRNYVNENPCEYEEEWIELCYDYVSSNGSILSDVTVRAVDDAEEFYDLPTAIKSALYENFKDKFAKPYTIFNVFIDNYLNGKAQI